MESFDRSNRDWSRAEGTRDLSRARRVGGVAPVGKGRQRLATDEASKWKVQWRFHLCYDIEKQWERAINLMLACVREREREVAFLPIMYLSIYLSLIPTRSVPCLLHKPAKHIC